MEQQETGAHRPLFSLGHIVATPGALAAFAATGERITRYIAMHQCGVWGDLDPDDIRANERALKDRSRLLSAYHLNDGTRIWIWTEADRSSTCVMVPEDY
jgi:hypothetical protein